MLAAGAFIVGVACFFVGIVIEFSSSENIGSTMVGIGALLMVGSRLVATPETTGTLIDRISCHRGTLPMTVRPFTAAATGMAEC
jgi:hypothetical protein